MIKDTTSYTGQVTFTLLNSNNEVIEERVVKNLVVTAGKNHIASRMVNASSTAMSHMAVGSSNTAAASGDTTLGTEISRVALTAISATGTSVSHTATFGPGVGTGTLQEAGLFNASSGGTMLARTVFSTITKGAGDSLQVSWAINVN